MNSRERVIKALKLGEPDRVPWVELYVRDRVVEGVLGKKINTPYDFYRLRGPRIAPEFTQKTNLDNSNYDFSPIRFTEIRYDETIDEYMFGNGIIKTEKDIKKIKLPNPDDESFYEPAYQFLKKYKGDSAAMAHVRTGFSNTYISMGLDTFSLALYDNPKFVTTVMDIFAEWSIKVITHLNELDFDLMCIADDLSGDAGTLISPQIIREVFFPRMKKVVKNIKLPWIYHSDGDVLPVFDDLLTLGMNGFCPIQPDVMDIVQLNKDYGDKVCLMGNVSVDLLSKGTPEQIDKEVKQKIETLGTGGGYILASSNGIAASCKPENVIAMDEAVSKYGKYPISS